MAQRTTNNKTTYRRKTYGFNLLSPTRDSNGNYTTILVDLAKQVAIWNAAEIRGTGHATHPKLAEAVKKACDTGFYYRAADGKAMVGHLVITDKGRIDVKEPAAKEAIAKTTVGAKAIEFINKGLTMTLEDLENSRKPVLNIEALKALPAAIKAARDANDITAAGELAKHLEVMPATRPIYTEVLEKGEVVTKKTPHTEPSPNAGKIGLSKGAFASFYSYVNLVKSVNNGDKTKITIAQKEKADLLAPLLEALEKELYAPGRGIEHNAKNQEQEQAVEQQQDQELDHDQEVEDEIAAPAME